MAKPGLTFAGFLYDDAGDAINGATVNLYTANGTSTSLANTTTNSSGKWTISHTPAALESGEYDVQITSGASKRRIKFDDGVQLASLDAETLSVRANEGQPAASYMFADEGEDAGDRWRFKVADGGVLTFDNDIQTQNTYVAHVTITPNSTVASSTVAIAGHGTVGGDLTVTGATTLNGNVTLGNAASDVVTVNGTLAGASALQFEGATADGYETTVAFVDPTADRTIYFPNLGGYLPVLASASTTQVSATPEELNIMDGVTSTAAEINLIDGGTARGTTAIADGDGVLINDGGTMRMTTVETLATYLEGEMNAFSLATTFSNTITVGVDDTGYDVDDLILSGAAGLNVAGTATLATVDINAGAIDGTTIGASSASAGTFAAVVGTTGSFSGVMDITDTTDSSDASGDTGALRTEGGASIAKKLYVGTDLDVDGTAELDNITIAGSQGSDGQVLTSTGSGVAWEAVSSTSTASVATTVTITDNESTDEDNAIIFTAGGDVDGGNLGLESDGTLTYNPSTGKVTATGFVGDVTGNASGTALTVTQAAQSAITSLGTLTTLTVDNVIINGTTIGHTSDTDLMTVGSAVLTVAGEVDATTLDISSSADIAGDLVLSGGADGALQFTNAGENSIKIPDNQGSALIIEQADNAYMTFVTTDSSESITIAKATKFSDDVEVADSKFIEFASAAGTPTTDDKVQGIVVEFVAYETITAFDAVYVSTTTGRVGRADANDAAKLPAIGIAIEGQGSAGSSVRVLTHGVYRDDGGFGGNMTVGADLYTSETPGTLTTTAPGDDGDFVQLMGVAVGVRSAFINPDLTIIEVA